MLEERQVMICKTIQDAIAAAKQAQADGVKGLYPSACIVMAAEVEKLKNALTVIAFPRRGTPEEIMSVEEIGKYAAQFIERE